MTRPVMDDAGQVPTEEMVFGYIGEKKAQWASLFDWVQAEHPDLESEWRFYKDGNSWLMKTVRKKKTIFWLSVVDGGFIVTFYFGDKAEPAILESPVSQNLKDAFVNGKRYGRIRGISIPMDDDAAVADVKTLIPMKQRF